MIIAPKDALSWLERYRLYLDFACPVKHCSARRGEPCRDVPAGKVHQSRQALAFARTGVQA